MADYKLVENPNMVLKVADGLFIPLDPENRHYQAYLEWLDLGNTPDPA